MPALETLRRRTDFEALSRGGSARTTRLLVARSLITERPTARIGLAIPASIGGAVQRNRVRRRLRALLRARTEQIGVGVDLLLIARPGADAASYAELGSALDEVLRVVVRR